MTESEAIERLKCLRLYMSITDKKSKCKFLEEDYSANKMAIQTLEEVQEYHKIGTVDECRAAVEKQKPKKPIKDRTQGIRYTSAYSCPNCGRGFTGTGIAKYCYHCGQRLDWSDEDV